MERITRIKRLLSKQQMTAKINLKLKIDKTSTFKNSGTPSWERRWTRKWRIHNRLMQHSEISRLPLESLMSKSLLSVSWLENKITLIYFKMSTLQTRKLISLRSRTKSSEIDFMTLKLILKLTKLLLQKEHQDSKMKIFLKWRVWSVSKIKISANFKRNSRKLI